VQRTYTGIYSGVIFTFFAPAGRHVALKIDFPEQNVIPIGAHVGEWVPKTEK